MNPERTIGLVGGGQLAYMMVPHAKRLGFDVLVLDKVEVNGVNVPAPATHAGAEQIVGGLKDRVAIKELAQRSNYIGWEIEHIDAEELIEQKYNKNKHVNPRPEILKIMQNKYLQKRLLEDIDIPVVEGMQIDSSRGGIMNAVDEYHGYPIVIKAQTGGFDGRSNHVIQTEEDIEEALKKLKGPLYAERFVNFDKELAVMVARDVHGSTVTYPVVETSHKRNICHEVVAKASIRENVSRQVENIALKIADIMGPGISGIEYFLANDKVLVNEIAFGRVHNSGHFTDKACITDQFEQQVRAITGLPLGDARMTVGGAAMVNILGEREGEAKVQGLEEALRIPGVHVTLYRKAWTRVDRKMGHITVVDDDPNEALEKGRRARKLVSI